MHAEDVYIRKSYIKIGETYFWTATINKWQRLLQSDVYKEVIIRSLEYLSNADKIEVFGFVIMPNHIHLIWRTKELNYMHANPTAEHWKLVTDPCEYIYSTAKYYEIGEKNYSFVKDLREEF